MIKSKILKPYNRLRYKNESYSATDFHQSILPFFRELPLIITRTRIDGIMKDSFIRRVLYIDFN